MSMRKRFLFAMLFTIVVLAAPGRVSVYKAEFDVPNPNTWSRAPVPVALLHLPWSRVHFFPINLRTPRSWVLESCWWRAAASATRISQEQ